MAENVLVQDLSTNEFNSFVGEGFALVDFFADWCMPCIMMSPIIDDLGKKFEGKIKFGKVDVGENQDLAGKHGISSIPNFILFKDGKQVDQFVGAMPLEDFEEKLNKHL
jgi:thioredoxin 1